MLNSCFESLYRVLGLGGGGFYPMFVAVAIISMNVFNQFMNGLPKFTPSMRTVIRIESILFLLFPVTCILESRVGWERFRKHREALESIKVMVGSKTKYKKQTFIQQVLLLICPLGGLYLQDSVISIVAAIPTSLVYLINYTAVVRYSNVIWTIQDLFKHLNYRLEESLQYQRNHTSHQEYTISRICTTHKRLVDEATGLNSIFQIQMLVCLLLIIVRCLIYPSTIVMLWLDPHDSRKKCFFTLSMVLIDLIHVTSIFHPPSMAVIQARNTCKILRSVANKGVVDSEMVRLFLKKLMMQDLKFSLLDLVEQNNLNIILVLQYITTRLFILMTF